MSAMARKGRSRPHGLQGEWHYETQEVDGAAMPAGAFARARLLLDRNRFRMESPEGTYEGRFTLNAEAKPARIDIEFVEGPEAGNRCYGLYELDGDQLTLCLGVVGAARPAAFATRPGSGHALQRLRRVTAERPARVTGGRPQTKPVTNESHEDSAAFDVEMTPLLRRLEGDWVPVQLVRDGKPLDEQWLPFGSRTSAGNEVKVVFGGQVIVHAKMRIDESAKPVAVDYLNLAGTNAGSVSRGIMEWVGEEVRFNMAGPGGPRPTDFAPSASSTLSQWRRKI